MEIYAFLLFSNFKKKLVHKFSDFVKCLGILVISRNPEWNSNYMNLLKFLVVSWNNWFHTFTVTYICQCVCTVSSKIYVTTSSISRTYFTLGNCQNLNISKHFKKSWKFHRKMRFWLKNFYILKQYGGRRLLSELPNQASVDRVRCVAVKDLMLSEEDKPKRHRSAREISRETAIHCANVHRITVSSSSNASNDVVLSCCLKPIASLVSLADMQSYQLQ